MCVFVRLFTIKLNNHNLLLPVSAVVVDVDVKFTTLKDLLGKLFNFEFRLNFLFLIFHSIHITDFRTN